MVNCFLCFSEEKRRKFVSFHAILSSSRTVAEVVREYFPAVPQNLPEEPVICSRCYTTMKEFSELVDIVQVTHSYPKVSLVKCEAFEFSIKTEPDLSPLKTVDTLDVLSSDVVQGVEMSQDEFMIMMEDELEEEFVKLPSELPVKVFGSRRKKVDDDDEDYQPPRSHFPKTVRKQFLAKPVTNIVTSTAPSIIKKPEFNKTDQPIIALKAALTNTPAVPAPVPVVKFVRNTVPALLKKIEESRNNKNETASKPIIEPIVIKCYLCGVKLQSLEALTVHFKELHPGKPLFYSCCKTLVKTRDQIYKHIVEHHSEDGSELECEQCSVKFNNAVTLFMHQSQSHSPFDPETKFQCYRCNFKCSDSLKLAAHLEKSHPFFIRLDVSRYRCRFGKCREEMVGIRKMQAHVDLHRYDHNKFECFKCNFKCRGYHRLNRHFGELHKIMDDKLARQCERCGFLTRKSVKFQKHMANHRAQDRIDRGEGITCPTCKKVFGSEYTFRGHDNTVHKKSNYKVCEICSQSVRCMRAHMSAFHEEGERVKCPHCTTYLKNAKMLQNHITRLHPKNPTRFPCNECEKIFHTSPSLRSHVFNIHKLKRVLPCRFCPKLMKTPLDVKEHEATHTGVDLYFCEWCPKSFKFGASYRGHRKREHKGQYIPRRERKKFFPKTEMKVVQLTC